MSLSKSSLSASTSEASSASSSSSVSDAFCGATLFFFDLLDMAADLIAGDIEEIQGEEGEKRQEEATGVEVLQLDDAVTRELLRRVAHAGQPEERR